MTVRTMNLPMTGILADLLIRHHVNDGTVTPLRRALDDFYRVVAKKGEIEVFRNLVQSAHHRIRRESGDTATSDQRSI